MKKLIFKLVVLFLFVIVCSYKNSPKWTKIDEVILFDTITHDTGYYGNWITKKHFIIKETRYTRHIGPELEIRY